MIRGLLALGVAAVWACGAGAQDGVMGDVMSGKLVNPSVGVWAWYEIKDAASGERLFLRQAVVGEEKVGAKNGFWVETEIVPRIGFPVIYKMLLTGPAGNPKNIHKLLVREGANEAQEVPVDPSAGPAEEFGSGERKSLGKEEITTEQGAVEAEHVSVEQAGKTTEVWTSDRVPPMGIVKMVSADGELLLQRYGKGGPEGESAINKKANVPSTKGETKVTVKVNGESREVPQEESKAASGAPDIPDSARQEEAGSASAPKPTQAPPSQKKNFSKKKNAQ